MNLTVNNISFYNHQKYNKNNTVKKTKVPNVPFQGSANSGKMIKYAGYFLGVGILASFFSCSNPKTPNTPSTDLDSTTANIDNLNKNSNYTEKNDGTQIHYHYLPKADGISGDDYAWKEIIKPDGSIEKDSMEYKISVNPEGERREEKTIKNDKGDTIITTSYPDGSKEILIKNNINYRDTIYWANGNIKQIKNRTVEIEKGQVPADDEIRIIEQVFKSYDEKGILLYWDILNDSIKIDNYSDKFKYDKQGRLINDTFRNYEYKGKSEKPFKITEEVEGCKHIIEMDENGQIVDSYFKAANGEITPSQQVYAIEW